MSKWFVFELIIYQIHLYFKFDAANLLILTKNDLIFDYIKPKSNNIEVK